MKRRKPIARSAPLRKTRPKRVNKQRKAKNLLRAYGPPARRAWMRGQACLGCGLIGFSASAHIENDGKGRKAEACKTIPLCDMKYLWGGNQGCHQKFDRYERVNGFKRGESVPQRLAAETESRWQSYCTAQSPHGEAK